MVESNKVEPTTMTARELSDHDRAVIDQWPKPDDPREHRIVGALKDQLLSTNWGKGVFKQTAEVQLEHLRISLQHLDNPQFIHDYTQKVSAELARLTNSKIVEGQESLDDLPKGQPILLLTNHLGSYKLNTWPIKELRKMTGLKGPVQPLFYPLPLYYSAMYPVAKKLENKLYMASFEYPGQLGKIFRATESIEVPPPEKTQKDLPKGWRTRILINSTRRLIEAHPDAVITSFPEGGTTGKRNGKGPYDLELPWHTGSYVIARELRVTILPVAQYFNPESGFELKIFEQVKPGVDATDEDLARIGQEHFQEISAWLQERTRKAG